MYVLVPVAGGATLMLVVALLFNNLTERRSYPAFWW
jgi:CBS-domain-containing membrane protein